MTIKTKLAILTAVLLWASAFVGIRAGLQSYSPAGLALLRYLVASFCMGIFYFKLPNRSQISYLDKCALIGIGVVGIGIYNITLNYGELTVSSGVSSFITSQSPLITALAAIFFLSESFNSKKVFGFLVSIIGVSLISFSEKANFVSHQAGLIYILIATITGSCFTIFQKPYLKHYHPIETTTYIIWGGTLFLLFYIGQLRADLAHASLSSTLMVIYLGIFPAALGYAAWSYALMHIPASQAASFLYFIPFLATLLGWLYLGETLAGMALLGGLFAMAGVWLINQANKQSPPARLADNKN